MKRGGRPKTLATSSSCAASSSGAGGSWTEASAVAAERLADWQQNLSDQVSLLCHSTLIYFVTKIFKIDAMYTLFQDLQCRQIVCSLFG